MLQERHYNGLDDNTCVGYNWHCHGLTSGDNNLLLGHDAGRSTSGGGYITLVTILFVLGDDNTNVLFRLVNFIFRSKDKKTLQTLM